jgi:serine/threonine protein kinase
MRAPETIEAFVELSVKSGLLDSKVIDDYRNKIPSDPAAPATPKLLAEAMVRDGLLTRFQADSLLVGKWRGFVISEKYRLLQKLGAGGMGSVYLCEHMRMRRRVALKVLPLAMAEDAASVERFYLEARAVAALDHPNIVRAHDIDNDGKLHFIVLEHIDGSNLHDIVRKQGALTPLRAANYIRQAAAGLQHAHEAGVVHRDIKPGNLLLDRNGIIKLLDMGLARFFHEEMDPLLLKQEVGNTLGTAEYVAPEQVDESLVDIRADIYSLGATFYYLLTGHNPFPKAETTQQKLTWAQVRRPKPVRQIREEIPEELAQVLDKMMAKEVSERYQTPAEVVAALTPWTQALLSPPSEAEMPGRPDGAAVTPTPSRSVPSGTSSKAGPTTHKDTAGKTTPESVDVVGSPSSSPSSSSAVVTLKAPVRKTVADKRPSPSSGTKAKKPDSKPPVEAVPKSPSPGPKSGTRAKSPAIDELKAEREIEDLVGEEALEPEPPPVEKPVRPVRKPDPKPVKAASTAKIPAVKPSVPAKQQSRPVRTPALDDTPPYDDDDDKSDRLASRVLIFGAVTFAVGVLALLGWMLNR